MSELPTGTVTFLFTDIEGSTKLWEKYPDGMKSALARHDEILRAAIEAHGGYVFKTVGDAFCAAFGTAPDALEATLKTQRALSDEQWGETGPIKVRAALHTGAAEERGGDYFGPPVNRVARLLSAGHGGQMIFSQSTYELVRDELPEGTSLNDMGEHRLKDLARQEHVFQLVSPDLPTNFAPLKTLDTRPNNLPAQPTPLIGMVPSDTQKWPHPICWTVIISKLIKVSTLTKNLPCEHESAQIYERDDDGLGIRSLWVIEGSGSGDGHGLGGEDGWVKRG